MIGDWRSGEIPQQVDGELSQNKEPGTSM